MDGILRFPIPKSYFVVGGLPEVVETALKHSHSQFEIFQEVRKKQSDLVNSYLADMAKHAGKVQRNALERIWSNIPNQLAKSIDGASEKFVFKGVIPGIKGYERMVGAIDWLIKAGLVIKIPLVDGALHPLTAFTKENTFKLFLFDIGILGSLANLDAQSIMGYDYGSYKGYFAENYVLQELRALGERVFSWKENE